MPVAALILSVLILCAAAVTAADTPAPASPSAQAPLVMLKLDDVTRVTPRWKKAAEFIAAEGLKANFGIINSPLETEDPVLTAWVKELTAAGTIEFWCHGYDAKFVHDKDHKGEFEGSGYDFQLHSLQRSQELAKQRFGFEYTAFGPHWSGTDTDTDKALEQVPGIKAVFFYGPKKGSTSTKILIERRMELEKPIFHPNPAEVQARFEAVGKKFDYIALQGHADQWDDARFADFQTAVLYLKAQGCRFVTVSEWLAMRGK
jgi:peptidoglycan/xylan/chitin deacetylase (PgdA/CDA1 family)